MEVLKHHLHHVLAPLNISTQPQDISTLSLLLCNHPINFDTLPINFGALPLNIGFHSCALDNIKCHWLDRFVTHVLTFHLLVLHIMFLGYLLLLIDHGVILDRTVVGFLWFNNNIEPIGSIKGVRPCLVR